MYDALCHEIHDFASWRDKLLSMVNISEDGDKPSMFLSKNF